MERRGGMSLIRSTDDADPMQRLAAAVIKQAMEDAAGGPRSAAARRWLLDDGALWLGCLMSGRESPLGLMVRWMEAQPWFSRHRMIA